MTANDYQAFALRTAKLDQDKNSLLEECLMGLNGEAGEAIDIWKKVKFQGHELDKNHLIKELGDVAWYLAVASYAAGYDLNEVLYTNIEKLTKRYPLGFDPAGSLMRDKNDI